MVKRIAAIVFIFVCTAVAWMILGATIFSRTYDRTEKLGSKVASTWGTRQEQTPPTVVYSEQVVKTRLVEENGEKVPRTYQETVTIDLPLESSRVDVDLKLEHRMKGLLWYSTYKVGFGGQYVFRNTSDKPRDVQFALRFPAAQAIYDDVRVLVDGQPVVSSNSNDCVLSKATVAPGQTAAFTVGYRSQGLESWSYKFGDGISQVRDFTLNMKTNFKEIDFPDNTLSPTEKRPSGSGWDLTWRYSNLLSGFQIGMTMPEMLQPGPLAGQISFFAPVSLFFFFFIMLIITTLRNIDLHPMNYFFLATAFFAFHLLMAYLVDHMSIHAAFVICSAMSVFLVVSYLRLVVGMRFAAVEAGISQFIYLVLFSYAFFFKGFTGLAITIGSILTLFVVMQMTGRIKWAEKFAKKVVTTTPNGTHVARDPAGDWLG
jgi:inner membrane protein involved in colicin E2 resistance